ncbi:MAG: hypothetical protein JW722_01380 [Demequinaceae bacterium]|nr:hypothetical protein [Demequinaceae bacterium]
MFGRRRAERRRAQKKTERVLADARTAAEAARMALRESHSSGKDRVPGDEELADAVQAAILGSILPFVSEASAQGKKDRNRPRGGGAIALIAGIAIGAGIAAWARRDDDPDSAPLDDSEWELLHPSSTKAIKSAINETLDKADQVIRQAARVTAHTMGAAVGTVADAAGPTAELVTDKIKLARTRATSEVIRTLDDVDDVWGSDSDEPDPRPRAKPAKKPIPRKPVVGKPRASASKASASKASGSRTPKAKPSGA